MSELEKEEKAGSTFVKDADVEKAEEAADAATSKSSSNSTSSDSDSDDTSSDEEKSDDSADSDFSSTQNKDITQSQFKMFLNHHK